MTVKEAFNTLQQAMHDDPNYAWSWHCNLAMSAHDCGVDYETSNKIAHEFMRRLFEVNTKEPGKVEP